MTRLFELIFAIAFVGGTITAFIHLRNRVRRWRDGLRAELVAEVRSLNLSLLDITSRLRALDEAYARLAQESRIVIPVVARPSRDRPAPEDASNRFEQFLRTLDPINAAWTSYLEIHLRRISRTLSLVPPPQRTGRALELGAYLHMTPALACILGYTEVRGGYLGPTGRIDLRTMTSGGQEVFRCYIDHFNAEEDPFPYPNGHFDAVLACELLEHLLYDPMHLLLESRRVLDDGGALILTTPNVSSYTAIAKLLTNDGNPQLYSLYPTARTESAHIREYTPQEVEDALQAAGFRIEYLFTEKIEGHDSDQWVRDLLRQCGLPDSLRGEQIYCVGRKCSDAQIIRHPAFLYEPRD